MKFCFSNEKRGGAVRSDNQIRAFREVVVNCHLLDLNLRGPLYTWSRGLGVEKVKCRLDLVMVTREWMDCFKFSSLEHVVNRGSDLLPICVRKNQSYC